jgi:hypothetical protein
LTLFGLPVMTQGTPPRASLGLCSVRSNCFRMTGMGPTVWTGFSSGGSPCVSTSRRPAVDLLFGPARLLAARVVWPCLHQLACLGSHRLGFHQPVTALLAHFNPDSTWMFAFCFLRLLLVTRTAGSHQLVKVLLVHYDLDST